MIENGIQEFLTVLKFLIHFFTRENFHGEAWIIN